MSTAEITAYLAGVELHRRGLPVIMFLVHPKQYADKVLSLDGADARRRLGSDMWAYWVRRGYDEAAAEDAR